MPLKNTNRDWDECSLDRIAHQVSEVIMIDDDEEFESDNEYVK
jgi:hypothetical protein